MDTATLTLVAEGNGQHTIEIETPVMVNGALGVVPIVGWFTRLRLRPEVAMMLLGILEGPHMVLLGDSGYRPLPADWQVIDVRNEAHRVIGRKDSVRVGKDEGGLHFLFPGRLYGLQDAWTITPDRLASFQLGLLMAIGEARLAAQETPTAA